LWNPTNEDFNELQYAGRRFALKAGERVTVNDKCANHVLNAFGQRGLTFLKYGDKEEEVGAAAIETNKDFKRRQITNFNVDNEQRSMKKLGYLPPTKLLKQYALEMGIKLIEPYTLKDEEKAAISDSTRENAELKKELAELREMMKNFMAAKEEAKPRLTGAQRTVRGEGG
jgi:hypothetical protein